MAYPSKTDREAILAVAMQQVEQDGVEKLTIRGVASVLRLAPNALYRYFGSLAALQSALAEESRCLMLEAMSKGAAKKRPVDAIRGLAKAYVQFAREHPQIFALTLKPSDSDANADSAHVRCWRFVLQEVGGLYGEKRAPEAAVALWAFLHGITVLEAAGVFGQMKPASSFEFGLRMWLDAASSQHACHRYL